MENFYLFAGFLLVILFNIFALLLNRDKLLAHKGMNAIVKRPKVVLNAVVLFCQFLGVALVFIGFALKLGIVAEPYEALVLLKNALIFLIPVLLLGYYFQWKKAARMETDHLK